jgi:hypothetical protein
MASEHTFHDGFHSNPSCQSEKKGDCSHCGLGFEEREQFPFFPDKDELFMLAACSQKAVAKYLEQRENLRFPKTAILFHQIPDKNSTRLSPTPHSLS